MKNKWAGLIMIILCGVVIYGAIRLNEIPKWTRTQDWIVHEEYQVYSVTAPFGILIRDGNAVFLSGTDIRTDEVYIIKYMDGNILRTIRLNAEEHGIVVDGTFKVVESHLKIIKTSPDGKTTKTRDYYMDPEAAAIFTLHIPELPTPKMNLTSWYIGGN